MSWLVRISSSKLMYFLNILIEIPTFLVAGYETSRYMSSIILQIEIDKNSHSVAMAWALYALTQNKHVQTKLRQELSKISTDNPTTDDLNGLPYLDAVVRETLRLYPPAPALVRSPIKDDCIPLSKPFTDKKGAVCNEIRLVLIHFLWCYLLKLYPPSVWLQ